MIIRPICSADNPIVGEIIREVLCEFGANRPGFAWQDPELDRMTEAYAQESGAYFVVEAEGRVLGGGGIGPFICEQKACCELQKMYLLPEARGKGWGERLIDELLSQARRVGYQSCYLETFNSMTKAASLYKRKKFKALDAPLGNSGHNACDEWYLLELK